MSSAFTLVAALMSVALAGSFLAIGLEPQEEAVPPAVLASPASGPSMQPSVSSSPSPSPSATPEAVAATAKQPFTRTIMAFAEGTDPTELVRKDDGRLYYIDRTDGAVWLRDIDGYSTEAIRPGDSQGPGEPTFGQARLLVPGDPYLVVVDHVGSVWTWEGRSGGDWLLRQWATDGHGNYIGARTIDPESPAVTSFIRGESDFDVLVVFVDGRQVIRYRMPRRTLFQPPRGLLGRPYDEMTRARDLHADPDLYVLLPETVLRFRSGQFDETFGIETPPTETDYRLMAGRGETLDGRLYVHDAAGERILVFAKRGGRLLDEWASGPGQPAMADLRGMVVWAEGQGEPERLTWMTPDGIYESVLSTDPADEVQSVVEPPRAAGASDIAETTRSLRVLIRRLEPLQAKPEKTALDEAEIEVLVDQIASLQQDIERLSTGSAAGDADEPRTIDWQTPAVRFEADAVRITANGLDFVGAEAPFLDSWADGDSREYNAAWREHDRWMRLWFFLDADDTHWWVDEIYTYDGKKDGDWLYYRQLAPLTRTPRGEALTMDLDLSPGGADISTLKEGARLRIDGMRLTAFAPGTNTAPLEVTGCEPVPDDAGVVVEVEDPYGRARPGDGSHVVQVIDHFAEGTLLEGIDLLPPQEASARLTELGICHEFRYAYDFIDRKKDQGIGTSERWCSMPDVVRPRETDRSAGPPPVGAYEQLQRGSLSVTDDGYVRVSIRDEEPRERRMQPPAGWDCPTY